MPITIYTKGTCVCVCVVFNEEIHILTNILYLLYFRSMEEIGEVIVPRIRQCWKDDSSSHAKR
jgi:hypothetical protein